MAESRFVYIIFIRTTPEALWTALTDPEFMKRYWFGMHQECAWTEGAAWRLVFPDGRVADTGDVIEIDRPRRLVLRWRHELRPALKDEGDARCVIEIEPVEQAVKLTITHTIARQPSALIEAVAGGWPLILSNLKSLLEIGETILPNRVG